MDEARGAAREQEARHRAGAHEVGADQQPPARQAVEQRAAEAADDERGHDLREQQAGEPRGPGAVADERAEGGERVHPVAEQRHGLRRPRAAVAGQRAQLRDLGGAARHEPAAAQPVQCDGRPEHDDDVADREHVGHRQRGRQREHVAEERELRVRQPARVDEPVLGDRPPGDLERPRRGGHDAVVGGDRDEVEQPADADEPQPWDVAVGEHEAARGDVGEDVRPRLPAAARVREQRHRDDLEAERGEQEAAAAEAHVGEPGEPPARERDRDDGDGEQREEEHLCAAVSARAPGALEAAGSAHRTDVRSRCPGSPQNAGEPAAGAAGSRVSPGREGQATAGSAAGGA